MPVPRLAGPRGGSAKGQRVGAGGPPGGRAPAAVCYSLQRAVIFCRTWCLVPPPLTRQNPGTGGCLGGQYGARFVGTAKRIRWQGLSRELAQPPGQADLQRSSSSL